LLFHILNCKMSSKRTLVESTTDVLNTMLLKAISLAGRLFNTYSPHLLQFSCTSLDALQYVLLYMQPAEAIFWLVDGNNYFCAVILELIVWNSMPRTLCYIVCIAIAAARALRKYRTSSKLRKTLFLIKSVDNNEICSICVEEYAIGDRCRKIENCFHVFHCKCIDEWSLIHRTCPLCRGIF
jgi:hypothetical protein